MSAADPLPDLEFCLGSILMVIALCAAFSLDDWRRGRVSRGAVRRLRRRR
mgnify:CR=1 FL=1